MRVLRPRLSSAREGRADFSLATFKQVAQFNGAVFEGEANFSAMVGERAFSMAGARFEACRISFRRISLKRRA